MSKRSLFLLATLAISLASILAGPAAAQTFSVLHTFTPASGPYGNNDDGASPSAGLILSSNTLYGTATYGGNSGWGTLFAINADGSDFTTLYHFTGGNDGGNPYSCLVLSN